MDKNKLDTGLTSYDTGKERRIQLMRRNGKLQLPHDEGYMEWAGLLRNPTKKLIEKPNLGDVKILTDTEKLRKLFKR